MVYLCIHLPTFTIKKSTIHVGSHIRPRPINPIRDSKTRFPSKVVPVSSSSLPPWSFLKGRVFWGCPSCWMQQRLDSEEIISYQAKQKKRWIKIINITSWSNQKKDLKDLEIPVEAGHMEWLWLNPTHTFRNWLLVGGWTNPSQKH